MLCNYFELDSFPFIAGYFGVLGLLLIAMSLQDYRRSVVGGGICWLAWLAVVIFSLFVTSSLWSWVAIILLLIVYISPVEFSFCGDADLIPISAFISLFGSKYIITESLLVAMMSILIFVPLYSKYYCERVLNRGWHFGSKETLPVLPCFAFGWCFGGIAWIILFYFMPVFSWSALS